MSRMKLNSMLYPAVLQYCILWYGTILTTSFLHAVQCTRHCLISEPNPTHESTQQVDLQNLELRVSLLHIPAHNELLTNRPFQQIVFDEELV